VLSVVTAAPAAAVASSSGGTSYPSIQISFSGYYMHSGGLSTIMNPVVSVTNTSTVPVTGLAVKLFFQASRFQGLAANKGLAKLPLVSVVRNGLTDGWSVSPLTADASTVWATLTKDGPLDPGATTTIDAQDKLTGLELNWANLDEGAVPILVWADSVNGIVSSLPNLGYK
jgi:hypothetical protein